MKIKIKTAICIAILSLSGCSSEPNIEVSIESNQYHGSLVFTIQATTDEVIVKNVVINRGNCALPAGTAKDIERTVKLGFGQNYRGYSPSCTVNDVKEIEVTTNEGAFTFTF